ncbi:MAG: hypothetical protein ACJAYG_002408 [Oceanicoccus sp.]|jgi:hypothetical protein
MKTVKKTSEYTITQRRDDRYAVVDANNNPVNGDEKVKILLAEELIKASAAAPAPEPEEAPVEEAAAEEAPAEDAAAE